VLTKGDPDVALHVWVRQNKRLGVGTSSCRRRVAQVDRLRATCVPQAEQVSLTEELSCESLGSQKGL
jgi:hypothetical protein